MDVGDEGLWQLQVLLGALEISAPKIGRGRRTLKRDREMAALQQSLIVKLCYKQKETTAASRIPVCQFCLLV